MWTRRLGLTCHALAAALMLGFGVLYLTRSEFMPYHATAAGVSWAQLETGFQTLVLSFLRVAGAGFIAAGVSIAVLLAIPYRRGERWANWAIPAIGLALAVPTLYAVYVVQSRTPAEPPTGAAAGAIVLLVVGFLLSLRSATPTRAPADTPVEAGSA